MTEDWTDPFTVLDIEGRWFGSDSLVWAVMDRFSVGSPLCCTVCEAEGFQDYIADQGSNHSLNQSFHVVNN